MEFLKKDTLNKYDNKLISEYSKEFNLCDDIIKLRIMNNYPHYIRDF